MPKSMTGFGRVEAATGAWQVTVEIKTVNHRYLDTAIKIPRNLAVLETDIRNSISEIIQRGRVEVYIGLTSVAERPYAYRVDWGLAQSYVDAAKKITESLGLESGLTAQYLLSLPDVLSIDEERADAKELWVSIRPVLQDALLQVETMRGVEGERLTQDIIFRLDKVAEALERINHRSPVVVQEYAARLRERMTQFIQDGLLDPDRITAEAALYADKSNITEEVIRLHSHLTQTGNLLQESGPIGRKLDFMVQEMNREINTIGSKANDDVIAAEVIFCKSEIEKIREQAQNLE